MIYPRSICPPIRCTYSVSYS